MPTSRKPCPCGLPAKLENCCERYHVGHHAPTPEALMRSRYSAYALGLGDYLLGTWHISTRPMDLDITTPPQPRWIGLQVIKAASDDDRGTVEFIARFKLGGKAETLHERSRFVREEGRWFYLDGDVSPDA